MTVTSKWGMQYQALLDVGFLADVFTLDSPTLGILGTSVLGGSTDFADITSFVQNITINRGRPTQLDVFSPGTLTLQADDRASDRAFDPLNTASPWYQGDLGIAPRRKIRIVAGTADIYNGFIYDLDIIYDEPNLSFAQITAVDALAQLSQTTLNAFTPPNEFASDRIETILDRPEVGFGTAFVPRDINQSVSSLGTVAYEAGTNTLRALQEVQISENGRFFVTREGAIRFDQRVVAAVGLPVATLGGTAVDAIPMNGLENVYGAETIVNRVSVQIAGSTAVSVAEGTASQALYGIRSLALNGLPLETDAAGSALARSLVDRYQMPEVRFTGVSVNLNALSSAQQDTMAGIEIGDVLTISKEFAAGSPTTVNKIVVVEAVRHTIGANQHNVDLSVAPITLLNELILGDPQFGTLSTTNALGARVFANFVLDVSEVDNNYAFT
jgi:hypothetical protein